jgi:hypothetical protein
MATDDQFRPALARRRRSNRTRVAALLAAPDPLQLLEELVQATAPTRCREPARLVIVVAPAKAYCQHQPPAGEPVERGCLFGQQRGVGVQRRDQDRGGEANPLGHCRRSRERDQVVVVRVDETADGAQCAEAGLLGPPRPLHKRLPLGVGDRGWQANPNIHDDSSLTLGSTSPGQSTTEDEDRAGIREVVLPGRIKLDSSPRGHTLRPSLVWSARRSAVGSSICL